MAYGLITTRSLLTNFFEKKAGSTSELEKRCVYDVVNKPGKTQSGDAVRGSKAKVSRAYAICRASLQKSGRMKKGTADLTKLGKTIASVKTRNSDHAAKRAGWKRAIAKARKSR
jgi:hypothetical protein